MVFRWSNWIAGAGVLLGLAFPALAQQAAREAPALEEPAQEEPVSDAEALHQRLEILEAEYLLLKGEVALLRERLSGLLGPPGAERIYDLSVGNSPTRGRSDAPITLIEFGDFQSDYATRATHVVNRLLAEFPEPLRFVYKHYPLSSLHPQANEAALAALAAEKQERGWEMHDLLFQNSRRLDPNLYLLLAQQLGLDLSQFDQDRRSLWALERLSEDEKAAVGADVRGVPAFFLNGRRMENWRYGFLKSKIEELLNSPAATPPQGG